MRKAPPDVSHFLSHMLALSSPSQSRPLNLLLLEDVEIFIVLFRITGAGVVTGSLGGFGVALIGWLSLASTFDGGLEVRYKHTTFKLDILKMEESV